MKRFVISVAVVILALLIYLFVIKLTKPPQNPLTPTIPVPTKKPVLQNTYCDPKNLKAEIELSPAAGNIYGTFTIKNISQNPCQIVGNNFIKPETEAKNIAVIPQGTPGPALFTLSPGQTIYSQIHYPNGPQCQGPTDSKDISFSYHISPDESVTFVGNGHYKPLINVCQSPSEITQIRIWGMSDKPITQ